MVRYTRLSLIVLLAGATILACSTSDMPVTPKLAPTAATPTFARIRATDSLLVITDVTYGDTALILKRSAPLASDITVSATIDRAGGSLAIAEAGVRVDIPPGALSVPTVVTMTARKGLDVAYEFGPHGTTFNAPVSILQDLKGTLAGTNPALQKGMHGGYVETSLDSAFVDPLHLTARVKETQLGYRDPGTNRLRIFIGHFSGYLVAVGAF